jgi:phosphate transport system protein
MPVAKEDFAQHISRQFNDDLGKVHAQFLAMGGLVESQVADAMHALLDTDPVLADKVRAMDSKVNDMESEIDSNLVQILARRQPAASDLRMVIAISKANTDLERIGDEAAKIARLAKTASEEGESPRGYTETRHIGNQVRLMIREALDSFARLDVEKALQVLQADAEVDREYQTATRTLMTYMMEDPRYISRMINVLWVLRSLERIGDHARNLAEQVIYMVKGADVRHTSFDEVEKQVLNR